MIDDAERGRRLFESGKHAVPPVSTNGNHPADGERVVGGVVEENDSRPRKRLEDLEQDFWKRESLQTIYTAALSRMCSPWAVLACCTARALALVRPNATLPPLIGGNGSLNWFAAIAAPSGGGKGSALALARTLVKESVYQRNLGSGEGMVTSFQCRDSDEAPDGIRESVMFVADEIDNMTALGGRSGATLMGTLRSAFSGETLGFSYATKGRDIHLEAHSYRLTLVCSVQPGRAAGLLGDEAGGTPQRFMWFPGLDKRISRRHCTDFDWTPTLVLPPLSEWLYPREIALPDDAKDFILDARAAAASGDADPMDAHAIYAREKLAFGLAVLDGRAIMTLEDWELSGIAAEVSTWTRERTAASVREASRLGAVERGVLRGVEMDSADLEKDYQRAERTRRVLRRVLEKLEEAGEDGLSQRELVHKIANRDRRVLSSVLAIAVEDGLVKQDFSTGSWVKL